MWSIADLRRIILRLSGKQQVSHLVPCATVKVYSSYRQNRSVFVVMNSEVLNKFRTSVALMLAVVDVLKYSTWLRKAFENQRDS